MDVDAHLLDSVALPGARELVYGMPFERRGTGRGRALFLRGAELEVAARTLEIRGRVRCPGGAADGPVRPLGDGSRLTYDATTDTVHRWTA
ncbi:hypothetical protein [Streptomyces sp. NPDC058664]|uniref:hypothetical protein n=1 Tax=unclassified Streptomyces TaxID=2593676 RepID=UPI0036481817